MDERTDEVVDLLAKSRRHFDYPLADRGEGMKQSYYDLVQAVFELNQKVIELKKVVDGITTPVQ